ncbi:hypothetical protein GCM10017620_21550 [Brevundimonas intermedia]|uniref:Uncharacterized protein n=1 Tax=Brevundimonas intermedia TaxID=74315 RepID=A0ABQ5TAK7_9CAUL|nr:hypothetical protein [Brevundimonas intermedia]GLK49182.1 hypothetical protein GCM10017620_21550 [Brevundimonas intermedia]
MSKSERTTGGGGTRRVWATLVGACLIGALLSGFAGQADEGRSTRRAPYAALTSPTAAMTIVFSDVCLTAVRDGTSIEALALDHYLRPVPPRLTGSPTATAAWRLASYSKVFVVALPNGGCSASVEGGNPEGLEAAALALLPRYGDFVEGQTLPAEDNTRTVWCTAETSRPLIVVLVRRTQGRRPAFVANIFRAESTRPSFCAPARPMTAPSPT